MAQTLSQRRKADRDRKRTQREAAAAVGRPPRVESVNAAVVEALAFSMLTADQRTWIVEQRWVPINISIVIEAATDILVHRHQFDERAAKEAVVARLRVRDKHRSPVSVPSICPFPGYPRYRLRAPDEAVVRINCGDTPVTSSDTF